MSLMPVMWGKSRGWAWCAASRSTTCETDAGMCSNSTPLPPASQAAAAKTMTMPGSTVPMRKPRLVMPEMADVPRSVTHVANQYMAIEKSPTNGPFCASAGSPIV